jgi:hypothetical protein
VNEKLTQREINEISSNSDGSTARGTAGYTSRDSGIGRCSEMLIFATDAEKMKDNDNYYVMMIKLKESG